MYTSSQTGPEYGLYFTHHGCIYKLAVVEHDIDCPLASVSARILDKTFFDQQIVWMAIELLQFAL